MKRLFFALWPDDETRQLLVSLNQSIKSDRLKKVKPCNLHITLVFLGLVDEEAEAIIRRSVDNISIQLFQLHFDQLAFWRKPRILCLTTGQYDTQLQTLVDELKNRVQACGIKTEERPYKPHITLARNAARCEDIKFRPIDWQAQSFCLVESSSTPEGVQYQVLQSWKF